MLGQLPGLVPESQSLATLNPLCLQSSISGVAIFYFQSLQFFSRVLQGRTINTLLKLLTHQGRCSWKIG